MKKVFALLMTVCVLAACFALCVSADDEDFLVLNNCDAKFGAFTLSQDGVDGSTCWSKVIDNGFAIGQTFSAVDATDYDTLEFDFYISDAEAFKALTFGNNGLEITSGGNCDRQEISWKFDAATAQDKIWSANEGEDVKDGWNHVILPLATAVEDTGESRGNSNAGPFDISRINYMRIFMVSPNQASNVELRFDNFIFTNKAAALDEAAVKDAKEKIDALNTAVSKLTADTLDNTNALLQDVIKALASLSDNARTQLTQDQLNAARTAKAAINEFVKSQETQAPETVIETEAIETEAQETTAQTDEKTGCGSVVMSGAVVLTAVLAASTALVIKKKEG